MRFPYVQFRGKFSPIVPIKFRLKNGDWIELKAYVDSGAGFSIFHAEITEILGLKLEAGEKVYVTVGDGSLIPVYTHQVLIQLADDEFEVMVGFSRRLGIGFNIIGRADIFDRYKICFDEMKKVVEFYLANSS